MALYEFQPSYNKGTGVSGIQVFKGGVSPRIESPGVWIPRQLIFPQRHLSFLRKRSSGNLHTTIARAVQAGIIETQNLEPELQKKWIEKGSEWLLEEEAQHGGEGFELHIDPDTNTQAIDQSKLMGIPTSQFMVLATAPIQFFPPIF